MLWRSVPAPTGRGGAEKVHAAQALSRPLALGIITPFFITTRLPRTSASGCGAPERDASRTAC